MEAKLRKTLKGGEFKDVPAARSRTMAAIRGRGNRTTELRMRMAMVRAGIAGWETNAEDLPGKPDFFFRDGQIAVFIDGCFWHGCPKCGHYPKARRLFWRTKILRNKERDKKNRQRLRRNGIEVISIWEHSLKNRSNLRLRVENLKRLVEIRASH